MAHIDAPRPVRPLKRALDDMEPGGPFAPSGKRHQPLSPASSRVHDWVESVARTSCPPTTRPRSCPVQLSELERIYESHPPLVQDVPQSVHEMSQAGSQSIKRSASASSLRNQKTSHALYRKTLLDNGVTIDDLGKHIPAKLKDLLNKEFLHKQSSSVLSHEKLDQIANKAAELAFKTGESAVNKLVGTDMFLMPEPEVTQGGNILWTRDGLPRNPECWESIATPKPDFYYGYDSGIHDTWKIKESSFAGHPTVRPYAYPSSANKFPFLALEVKSEVSGGTLWHAENQAAGSGSHCVSSMRWLLLQTPTLQNDLMTDSIAFTGVMTHREIIFHVHYYLEDDGRFYMSYLRRFSTMEHADIQACHNLVRNITEWALTTRQDQIRKAAALLYPTLGPVEEPENDGL